MSAGTTVTSTTRRPMRTLSEKARVVEAAIERLIFEASAEQLERGLALHYSAVARVADLSRDDVQVLGRTGALDFAPTVFVVTYARGVFTVRVPHFELPGGTP